MATFGSVVSSAWIGIALVLAFGVLAIFGAETGRRAVTAVAKPIATAALLLVVGAPSAGTVTQLISIGILFSVVGDAFLVAQSDRAFMAGTAAFLTAQLLYAAAFWTMRVPARPVAPIAALVVISSTLLVATLWKTGGSLRPAILVYGLAITSMVGTALGTLGGPLPPLAAQCAATGAVLFYISDATVAWDKFKRPLKHGAWLTMGVYWLGQIGIALCARLAG
jgi:uncharacterized membrane protein YhhN